MYTLITAANSAKAQQLKNTLSINTVILGDYMALPAFMLKADLIQLPNPNATSYTHQMLTLCLDKNIEKVHALRDEELSLLIEAKLLFEEYGIQIAPQLP